MVTYELGNESSVSEETRTYLTTWETISFSRKTPYLGVRLFHSEAVHESGRSQKESWVKSTTGMSPETRQYRRMRKRCRGWVAAGAIIGMKQASEILSPTFPLFSETTNFTSDWQPIPKKAEGSFTASPFSWDICPQEDGMSTFYVLVASIGNTGAGVAQSA
jgi:hypothetical protein